jgi:hypothetical protein
MEVSKCQSEYVKPTIFLISELTSEDKSLNFIIPSTKPAWFMPSLVVSSAFYNPESLTLF